MRRRCFLILLVLLIAAQGAGSSVGVFSNEPPHISAANVGLIEFPEMPDVLKVRTMGTAHRDSSDGNVRTIQIKASFDMVWIALNGLSLTEHELFHDRMVQFESYAMSGRTFSLWAEGDNTNSAVLWADAAAGATSITVQFGFPFTGPPFPEGRDLVLHFNGAIDPATKVLRDQFVGVNITDLGFGQWQIDLDRPLAHSWPGFSDATVESRWAWSDAVLLGDEGIIRYRNGMFDIAMLVRTNVNFVTP